MINGTKRGTLLQRGRRELPLSQRRRDRDRVAPGVLISPWASSSTPSSCAATAFVILLAGPGVGGDGVRIAEPDDPGCRQRLGAWTIVPGVLIFLFSSVIQRLRLLHYEYVLRVWYLTPWATWTVRVVCRVGHGRRAAEPGRRVEPSISAMAVMTIIAVAPHLPVTLGRWRALKDTKQRKAGIEDPVFVGHNSPLLRRVQARRLETPQEQKH